MTRQRINYALLGLTMAGTVRIYERHPELAGLGRLEYRRRWMRRLRLREKAERVMARRLMETITVRLYEQDTK